MGYHTNICNFAEILSLQSMKIEDVMGNYYVAYQLEFIWARVALSLLNWFYNEKLNQDFVKI